MRKVTPPEPTFFLDVTLGPLALRQKRIPLLRLYELLRLADGVESGHGDGKVTIPELKAAWQATGYSDAYLRGLLIEGEAAKWWHVDRDQDAVWYSSPRRICEAAGVDYIPLAVAIPVSLLYGKLSLFAAAVSQRCLYAGKDRPVTWGRDKIREATGLSRPTQCKYERDAKTKVQHNAWVTPWHSYDKFPGGVLGEGWEYPQAHGWRYCPDTQTMMKVLPSSYSLAGVATKRRWQPRTATPRNHTHLSYSSGTPVDKREFQRRFYHAASEYTGRAAKRSAATCYIGNGQQVKVGKIKYATWNILVSTADQRVVCLGVAA